MNWIERTVIFTIVIILAGLTAWMQSDLIKEEELSEAEAIKKNDADYYIENFTAIGMDINGKRQYVLEANRLVHYPYDDTSLLDKPHIIQFVPDRAPMHVYSETGWVSPNGEEVLLTGNVRVIRGRDSSGSGGVTTTDRMNIVLKEPISDSKWR